MADFLIELLSEEIPARMQGKARVDLERLFMAELDAAGLKVESLVTWSTPRRLALIARGLPTETEAVREERKGPKADAPDQAVDGFLRSTGLTRGDLEIRDVKGKPTYFAVIDKPGRATADVLGEAIPAIIRAFPWPKSMRWGAASASTESLRWVRPLQGIVAILGDRLVECEIDGIVSGYETVGHRFHHTRALAAEVGTGSASDNATGKKAAITIGGADDYAEKLRACHVIVDHKEREGVIRTRADELAKAAGLTRKQDPGLVEENAGLTEWPVPLLGSFDESFLEVAPEAITLAMRSHQKYFACEKADGSLSPHFICVANLDAADGGAHVVAGNEKVLAARLSDAKFFWEQDQKITLAEHAKKLDQIVFHEKLGTVADKVDRVAKLARWLVEEGIVTSSPLSFRGGAGGGADTTPNPSSEEEGLKSLADKAEQAARLCKADLVTGMVGEFAELQGVMGGYYAANEGLDPEVAAAIRDHYKPVGQGDDVPTAPVTVAVSLADKLDTVFSFFGIGKPPSGSKDPFALRRAAIAILRIVETNAISMSIELTLDAYHRLALAETHPQLSHFTYAEARMEKWAPEDDRYPEVEELSYPVLTEADVEESLEPIVWHAILPYREFEERSMVVEDEFKASASFTTKSMEYIFDELLDFFADRLKVQQREAGVRHDLIDAVFALGGEDDLVRLLARVHALQDFLKTADGANLLAGYKRAANILKKEGWGGAQSSTAIPAKAGIQSDGGEVDSRLRGNDEDGNTPSYSPEPEEAILLEALGSAETRADAAIAAEDFEGAMAALATLRKPIDAFFEKVTVNDDDPVKRASRLDMLARFRDAVHSVADFSKIEG